MTDKNNKLGSIWRRWDPHIHTPGTAMNDQFGGGDPWEEYLSRIENSSPKIEALGVTDYCSLNSYEAVLPYKNKGKLPNILIFPNVELRYAVGTDSGSPINFHLLISPDDKNHIREAKRFLERLTYRHSNGDTYKCSRSDLIGLGRAHKGNGLDDNAAYSAGVNQFKVEVDHFTEQWNSSPWIQKNALIAVAVGSKDGTSGLQGDSSLATLREKIESSAHIIFSSSPKQQKYWLGEGAKTPSEIKNIYGGLKPCIHGSDAHKLDEVGEPDKERYCWIKGDATFETLRQICIEPKLRVRIQSKIPDEGYASQTIDTITMENAPWFRNASIRLNGGLVGIIGARGSGKSALADMIAAGGYSLSSHLNEASFVKRAGDLLADAKSILKWRDGSITSNTLDNIEDEDLWDSAKVQYLSQQFVERLCSAKGATQDLINEIERVIFNIHAKDDRMGAGDFQELLSLKARRGREERNRHEATLSGIGAKIAKERDKQDNLASNVRKRKDLVKKVEKQKRECSGLIPKEAKMHAEKFNQISKAANEIRNRIDLAKKRANALNVLNDHVTAFRDQQADDELEKLKFEHRDTGLDDESWEKFKTDFIGDVFAIITQAKKHANNMIVKLKGEPLKTTMNGVEKTPSETSLLPESKNLSDLPLNLLEQEESRLRHLMSADEDKRKRHTVLSEQIRLNEQQITKLEAEIKIAEKVDDEINRLNTLRKNSYRGIFGGIVSEEKALRSLYHPLNNRLRGREGALGSLKFSVRRRVDLEEWAQRGEDLIDRRKTGDFKGCGSLLEAARKILTEPWEKGTASEVAEAMAEFRSQYNKTIRKAAPVDSTNIAAMRRWGAQVSEWLYSTEHIQVSYGMKYNDVEIETLSPGARGIVLLLLYLAIDTEDDRPLIIDQPEENLDPKSVFDELVYLFRNVKQRRQIIIVTHNPNLIVNTDVEQVIVAKCGPMRKGALPNITYTSGSLEDPQIRKHVCEILEGGETAFLERAKRLRVNFT